MINLNLRTAITYFYFFVKIIIIIIPEDLSSVSWVPQPKMQNMHVEATFGMVWHDGICTCSFHNHIKIPQALELK